MYNPEVKKHIMLLKHPDSAVRRSAAYSLGIFGDFSAIPALTDSLKDKDYSVRRDAAVALGKIGGISSVFNIAELLKDENYDVRWHAAYALGEIGHVNAVPSLIRTMKDKDSHVRKHAIEALGKIGVPAIPALIVALKDVNSQIRRHSAYCLGKMGDSVTLPRIILRTEEFAIEKRIQVLDELRRVNYEDNNMNLRFNFPGNRELCRQALAEEDTDIHPAARQVLHWLDGSHQLLRASQLHCESETLLRPVEGSSPETEPGTLLRAADIPNEKLDIPPLLKLIEQGRRE